MESNGGKARAAYDKEQEGHAELKGRRKKAEKWKKSLTKKFVRVTKRVENKFLRVWPIDRETRNQPNLT